MPKVLVVDDDVDLLEMVSLVLSTKGFDISCIDNGEDFLESVKKTLPDIILLDIFLGPRDGRILCHDLKTESDYKNIPVILYSAGHISESSIKESQANEFVIKPFNIHSLVDKINALIA